MSLILTQINKFGIVFVTDSNVILNKTFTDSGDKIFKIPHLNAALCVAGTYSVGSTRMDCWMNQYISNNSSKSLKQFAQQLSKTLEKEMTTEEKRSKCIIQICGFVEKNNTEHPEMWGVSNVDVLKDGNYSNGKDSFGFREDFWRRDWKNYIDKEKFKSTGSYGYIYYINGSLPGRASYNQLTQYLNKILIEVWQKKKYKFRPPKDLNEYEDLAKFTMDFIILMFQLSNYLAKSIGGDISSFCIKPKKDTWIT